MHPQPRNSEPRWINRFFMAAAALFCLAALTALWQGWRQGVHHHRRPIADITVNLGGRPVREHCTTCHPDGAAAAGGQGSPQAHPDIAPHAIETLGCTGCHLGEGMALDQRISHGLPGLGARRVLTGEDLQASCFRCHPVGPLPGAESPWQGYRLFREKACDSCHQLSGSGGHYGPGLGEVGSHLGLEQIVEAIRDPKQEPENSIMPRFPLSGRQVAQIGHFLKSRVRDPFHATPMEIRAGLVSLPEAPPAGGTPLHRHQCLACHRYGETDGRIAPDLTFIGGIRDREYLKTFLQAPAKLIPGAIMPRIPLSAAAEASLLDLLEQEAAGPVTVGHHGEPTTPEEFRSKQLYMTLCQRCHGAAGDGHGPIQPNLANFPRPFSGNAEFFRRAGRDQPPSSLSRGIPGTSMPPFGRLLGQAEREEVLGLVFAAFIGIDPSDRAALPPLPARPESPPPPPRIDLLFGERCVRCHGIAGTGTGPEHLRYLPRPRNLTNKPYFAVLAEERIARTIADGVSGTAMPAFRDLLGAPELWGMVEKVRRLSGTGGR